jgi:hypothetical protein
MSVLCSCLERKGIGGYRCQECKKFQDEVEQNVSKIREKKRGDLGKLYRWSNKKEAEVSTLIYQRREALSVKGRAAARASAHATPQRDSPKPGHCSKHTSVSYREPPYDEFKKKFSIITTEDLNQLKMCKQKPNCCSHILNHVGCQWGFTVLLWLQLQLRLPRRVSLPALYQSALT